MNIHRTMLALSRIQGVGAMSIYKIAQHLKQNIALLWDTPEVLDDIPGLAKKKQLIKKSRVDIDEIEKEYQYSQQHQISFAACFESQYPKSLHHVDTPPPFIYWKGTISDSQKSIAIVGSRKATYYGKKQAYRFARELAERGIVVVSGLARGIDIAAHQGAIAAGGKTIAVLASGLSDIYPKEHSKAALAISQNGALVTEYPAYAPPLAVNFPKRNRIISGLTSGTLVVEADIKSGALITAKHAMDQGKEVFAVPGQIDNPLSSGPHCLIQQGAKLTTNIEEILEELHTEENFRGPTTPSVRLSPEEQKIYDLLGAEPISLEELYQQTTLAVPQIMSMLLILQTKKVVFEFPGKRYAKLK